MFSSRLRVIFEKLETWKSYNYQYHYYFSFRQEVVTVLIFLPINHIFFYFFCCRESNLCVAFTCDFPCKSEDNLWKIYLMLVDRYSLSCLGGFVTVQYLHCFLLNIGIEWFFRDWYFRATWSICLKLLLVSVT